MAAAHQPALRVRLDPSTEAIISVRGIHFVRGREAFYLDGRAAKKLAAVYAEVEQLGMHEAFSRILSGDRPDPSP